MENKNYSTVFEADLAYLRSLGDTSECATEFEVRLKTLRKLGGDIQTTTPLLYEIEKKILDFLGGDSSLYDNIYFIRKAIAEKQGVNTEGLHTIYAIAVASLNSEPVDIKYTITFVNYDGTVLETKQVSEGEIPIYTGATPIRESDAEYAYNFSGWSPDIVAVTGNATYTAQYTAVKQVYNIKFVNYDGSLLGSYSVAYGATPSYLGATPVKPSDEEYNYTFNGWLPEISPVSGNAEYVAQYTATEIPVGPDLTLPYVTFTAEQANSTIGLTQLSTNQTLEYSTDTTNWNTMDTSTTISLPNVGDKVYVRGILSANNSTSDSTNFKMSGKIAASGNCNAIWNYQDLEAPLKQYCGRGIFSGCSALTTAPELPAKTLADYCYQYMFSGCSALTTAPELPATTMKGSCYNYMFNNCTSLTAAPELPAKTLQTNCYQFMFFGCTSLTTAPELPATTMKGACYYGMFQNCTSLTTAPELPAKTLYFTCYQYMFSGCTSLNKITCLATNISAFNCTKTWLSKVSSTGTFIKDPNMTAWTTGSDGIPDGWTVEDYVG